MNVGIVVVGRIETLTKGPDRQAPDSDIGGVDIQTHVDPGRIKKLEFGTGHLGEGQRIHTNCSPRAQGAGIGIDNGNPICPVISPAVDGGIGIRDTVQGTGRIDLPPVTAATRSIGGTGRYKPHGVGTRQGIGVLDELT